MMLHTETLGRGPDVVFLHGWGLHGGVFSRLARHLADSGLTVHLVDLPGHGHTPAEATFDIARIADQLALAFPLPVQVVGWSLGGLVAQHWAARHPDTVRSLSLVATSPRFVRSADWPHAQPREAIETVGHNLATDFEGTLRRFLALQTLGAPHARQTLEAMQSLLFAHGRPQGLMPALQALLEADARAVAPEIACPTGLFFGARDVITPAGAARWLAHTLPDARLHLFAQASHAPFLSHESDFIAALAPHLDRFA